MLSDRMNEDEHYYPSTFSAITKAPHYPLGAVMLKYRDALQALGLQDPLKQRLGKGAFGAAYEVDLGGKSVLKFTRDPTEAQTSAFLLGKRHQNVVDIYGVWVASDTHTEHLRGWYVVHRALMRTLSKKDAAFIDVIFDLYGDPDLDLKMPRPTHRAMIDKWRGYLREDLEEVNLPGPQNLAKAMDLLRQVAESVHAMHSLGVDWEDCHSGNLMRRADGTLVVADVGFGLMHKDTRVFVPELTPEVATEYRRRLSAA